MSDVGTAEARFEALLESAPDAMICVDHRGWIALVNAQAERLFGYDRAELIGQPIEILVPERDRAVHPGERARYFADPRPRPMGAGKRLAGRRRDGSEFPAEISLSAIGTGDDQMVSAAVRDVTERLAAEAERERLQAEAEWDRTEHRLEQARRLESLGQLAGGVAHDFNNLLGAILNYASFVRAEVERAAESGSQWTAVARDIRQIELAAERAAQLTRQLLAFARRETARPQTLPLNDVIADLDQILRRTVGERIDVAFFLAPDIDPIDADRGQLEQVLLNLAMNARDAMPDGGTLTVETAGVDVDDAYAASRPHLRTGPYIMLRVGDTGTGMNREVADRAFEPFYTTKAEASSGMGLATVYGIIRQAGGHAYIDSEPGVGTSVVILLPLDERRPVSDDDQALPAPGGQGETVLVIEDDDLMRDVTTRMLANNGYEVLAAANGPAGIEAARGHGGPIDLLLTDIVMPRMLGNEVADRIAAISPGTRVLFMSGYALPVLGSKGGLARSVDLIDKPFTEHDLLSRVRAALEVRG